VEWLKTLWDGLLRDVVLTVSGLVVVATQVPAAHPSPVLVGAGLALTAPSAYANLRKLGNGNGSRGRSSPPPGPPPPQQPSPADVGNGA